MEQRVALTADVSGAGPAELPPRYFRVIGDAALDRHLLDVLSAAWLGAADIGECLLAASRISPGDDPSWLHAWTTVADRVSWAATRSLAGEHRHSAGQGYLRASTYYRAAVRLATSSQPDDLALCRNNAAYFARVLTLLGVCVTSVQIPYETTPLPGYFFRVQAAEAPAPTIVVFGGAPGWAEDSLHIASAALTRGWHCLAFSGPGQGPVLREQGLPFRPDWEKVVAPSLDFVLAQPGIDPARLALVGLGFGGALAARAAAHEPRLRACVASPGVLSWYKAVRRCLALLGPGLLQCFALDPDAFNARLAAAAAHSPALRREIAACLWRFGAASPADALRRLQGFDNTTVVGRIRCHMLIADGTDDDTAPGQPRALYEALDCPKHYLVFTGEEAASLPGQAGAWAVSTQRIFDWLENTL